jgi:hypothetical protein
MNYTELLASGLITPDEYQRFLKKVYAQVGFAPLQKQWELLTKTERFLIFVGGTGAGKSITVAQYAWPRVTVPSQLPNIPKSQYWIVAENYGLTKWEFTYIAEALSAAGVPITDGPHRPQDGSWTMEIMGVSEVKTKSWTNPESLHAEPVQGMLICEAGLLTQDIWDLRLRPRLSRYPGSWCLWSGTLEEAGTYYKDMVRRVVQDNSLANWSGVSMATWENTVVYPGGLQHPEIQDLLATTPADIFMERYGAIPRQVSGLVYPEFDHTHHVVDFQWDKHQPVYLGIDPGGVYAVDVIQLRDDEIDYIDEIHVEQWATEDVIRQAVNKEWWPNVSSQIIDVTQKEQQDIWSNPRRAIWKELKKTPRPVRFQKVPVAAGIELVRSKLHSGRYSRDQRDSSWEFQGKRGVSKLRIHPKCQHIIEEMSRGYKYRKLRSGEYSTEPIAVNNHHCDALAYLLAHLIGYTHRPTESSVAWYERRSITV